MHSAHAHASLSLRARTHSRPDLRAAERGEPQFEGTGAPLDVSTVPQEDAPQGGGKEEGDAPQPEEQPEGQEPAYAVTPGEAGTSRRFCAPGFPTPGSQAKQQDTPREAGFP
jgi:hypothetical protein